MAEPRLNEASDFESLSPSIPVVWLPCSEPTIRVQWPPTERPKLLKAIKSTAVPHPAHEDSDLTAASVRQLSSVAFSTKAGKLPS
jgi:hypothetical protein